MSYSSRVRRQRNPHTNEEGTKEGFFSKKHDTGADQKKSGFFQAKLTVNEPGDSYEKEADAVANDVVNKSSQASVVQQKKISNVQRLSTPSEDEKLGTNDARMAKDKEIQEKPIQMMSSPPEKDKKEGIQKKEDPAKEEEDKMKGASPVQKKQQGADTSSGSGTHLSSRIEGSAGKGATLPQNTLHEMGSSFGTDFSNVKIHQDSEAVNMNKELQAQAFTHGNDIYFNSGKYDPQSSQGKFLLAHELTHVVQQQQASPSGIQRFTTTTVAKVRSLESEEYIKKHITSNWGLLGLKMADRVKLITDRLATVKPGTPEYATLTSLQGRWSTLQSLMAPGSTFDPARGAFPTSMTVDMANEASDEAALPAKSNRYVKKSIKNFLATLKGMIASHTTVADEDIQMHRFDPLFADADVNTLVGAIRGATFTTADVKAITGTETGDFTSTLVSGISPTKPGIKSKRANPKHLGLGQTGDKALIDALPWAASKGITIPAKPDPRLTPSTSIKVAAAYLGKMADILTSLLPSPLPTGDEFKKFVFGGYKQGHVMIIAAVQSFLKGKKKGTIYTWDNVKSKTGVGEGYVAETVERLS